MLETGLTLLFGWACGILSEGTCPEQWGSPSLSFSSFPVGTEVGRMGEGDRTGNLETAPEGNVIKAHPACRPPQSLLLVGFWSQLVVCQGHLGFLLEDTGTVYPKAGSSLFPPPPRPDSCVSWGEASRAGTGFPTNTELRTRSPHSSRRQSRGVSHSGVTSQNRPPVFPKLVSRH